MKLLEGAGWALNDRLQMTRSLAAVITRKPARPPGSAVEIIAFAPTRDEEESTGAGWIALVALALLLLSVWKIKDPALRVGCHERMVPSALCVALAIEVGVDEEPSP